MKNEHTPKDPIARYQRKNAARRRVGEDQRCACGEVRPEALVPGTKPIRCIECDRIERGQTPYDDHHPAGKANNPMTIKVPANEHRADLNTAQHEWPRRTLENKYRSPLLSAAGCVRGFVDTVIDMVKRLLLWIPEFLESLDTYLVNSMGAKWWMRPEFRGFAPKT